MTAFFIAQCIIFIVLIYLLHLDLKLFRMRLDSITQVGTLKECDDALEWLSHSREMEVRRRMFGSLYWEGHIIWRKWRNNRGPK